MRFRTMNMLRLALTSLSVAFLGIASAAAQAAPALEPLLRDDFSGRYQYELSGRRLWEFRDQACTVNAGAMSASAAPPLGELEAARIAVTLTPARRSGRSFDVLGLALIRDLGNDWRLLLVEGPDGRRYFELIERYAGNHQAQAARGPTRLASRDEGTLRSWDYATAYRLTLTLSNEGISGEIRDPSDQFWRRSFSFAAGRAVRRGRPALVANGMRGAFRRLEVDGQRTPALPGIEFRRGAAGSAAVLAEGDAAPIAMLLEKAGFGVTRLRWADLAKGRIPAESLDLLVLADARRMPAMVAEGAVAYVRAGGKLIAIGAPAFRELLVKSPAGDGQWVTPERYTEVLRELVKPRPASTTTWKRNACDGRRRASIVEDTAEGRGAWKISCDLQGWDGYATTFSRAFAAGESLLTFRAKGDATTPQLSVELTEQDGSRWIATVDLRPEWRSYVLQPADFLYWHSSKSGARGAAGDHFQPQNAARLIVGLSASHTPQCKAGPHAYWIKDIGTAQHPGVEDQIDAHVPELEGLSPSYHLHPLDAIAALRPAVDQRVVPAGWQQAWKRRGYSPNWRPGGRGLDRDEACRWVPVMEACDAQGRSRGALVSLFVGNSALPNALWANVGVSDPADAARPPLADVIVWLAKAIVRGCFLLEGGSRYFSYPDGERLELGLVAVNAGREEQRAMGRVTVTCRDGKTVFQHSGPLTLAPGARKRMSWNWQPDKFDRAGYEVRVELCDGQTVLDSIGHTVDYLRPANGEFARVEGSQFRVGGQPWFMQGINYRPNDQGGRTTTQFLQRDLYDPVIVERDLAWMKSAGINFLSAIRAPMTPEQAPEPGAFRDLHDFLNRCQRHGMRVSLFLENARPLAGADFEQVKTYITAAGIKDHPAIFCWELSWEPIFHSAQSAAVLKPDWNAWIVERYGSAAAAETDWGFKLPRDRDGRLETPARQQCTTHGAHDRAVAAFRRFFSDRISAGYRDIARPLRAWDPRHLIMFRFGACGIPSGERFAHSHSVGVAKHMDFMCPEAYDLRTVPWGTALPADDVRQGGLVTLYYRFVSREKPVVWMEFGYTVSGFHAVWSPEMVHVKPEQLARQREDFQNYYAMFLESGARGACPWWLPGGFRLGECSDFGLLDPDGAERPACAVMRAAHPQFARVVHANPERFMEVDFDAHYADAWQRYGRKYLDAVREGRTPYLRTAGTASDSATTPRVAVGNTPCNGHNPPKFLNAEFNALEIQNASGQWQEVRGGAVVTVRRGAAVRCRASIGNLGEAKWLAPRPGLGLGGVYLAGRKEYGLEFKTPITADTEYLADAMVREFTLVRSVDGPLTFSIEMQAEGRAYFGERRTITLQP
jgi:hypothetical protein